MALRARLRRLRKLAEGEMVSIPQRDGTVLRFPPSDLEAAFLSAVARGTGKDVSDHPLSRAARNTSDPKWRESAFAGPEEVAEPPADLSE